MLKVTSATHFQHLLYGGSSTQVWQNAISIGLPLLKVGKPTSQLSSFRPVSLTSRVVKTEEIVCIGKEERLDQAVLFEGLRQGQVGTGKSF